MSNKKILGLDLGSNSIGWALFEANDTLQPQKLIDIGVRIFQKSVEDKTPTPKNQARRNARLARRVVQRRARRKQKMLNYLVRHNLLPQDLQSTTTPEKILTGTKTEAGLGDPYYLRAKALDNNLTSYELGRVFLHLVQRRGFQSNRKTLVGDLVDDPDVLAVLEDDGSNDTAEDTAFKKDIANLYSEMKATNSRTLGEYLYNLPAGHVKRNRRRDGGTLRTDRKMYKDEFWKIIESQTLHHPYLEELAPDLYEIIFFQRPLKLKKDRVGKCSLEPNNTRAKKAWQNHQRFRYLQDINSLKIFDSYHSEWQDLTEADREKLIELFETDKKPTIAKIKKALGLSRNHTLNFENATNKNFKGNLTAISIREVFPKWDSLKKEEQARLEEDLITFTSKKSLKNRLINHWKIDSQTALELCLLEFEPEHSDLSLKAINKLLPFLEEGQIYSDARESAGYSYEIKEEKPLDKLPSPPEIPNPIVEKGLHELKRLVNALIKHYGKPDAIRLEMARDLEMNTRRYKEFTSQQNQNTKANEEAQEQYEATVKAIGNLGQSKYASHTDKLKYRLWKEQEGRCAYSNKLIAQTQLFTNQIEIDHIIPYSLSLNDSYMNKVVCFASENQYKGQKTPIEAFENQAEKWEQIEQSISKWYSKGLSSKRFAFMKRSDDLDKDFVGSQLTDTRYISREALHYLKLLGTEVTTVKGQVTSWLRHIWGMNSVIDDNKSEKDRSDHRHHAIDAAVIACIDRKLYNTIVKIASDLEKQGSELNIKDIYLDPLFDDFRNQVKSQLETILVAHAPERRVTGALHEETGIGFKEGIGAVYRKDLDESLSANAIKNIIDPVVKDLVQQHLEKHGGKPKQAFSPENPVYHKDGKTPIKRVRIIQSKATLKKLEEEKLGITNKDGEIFKWMTLGNTHHVAIFRNQKTAKYELEFVSAFEAKQRIARKVAVIQSKKEGLDFLFALHKNDLVSLQDSEDAPKKYYRVQKMTAITSQINLRLHTASTLNNKEEEVYKTINALLTNNFLQPVNSNILGHDKTHPRNN